MRTIDRIYMGIYDWSTAFTAVLMVLVHGVSWSIGGMLILFGLIVDLNRIMSSACHDDRQFSLGSLRFPVRLYVKPIWSVHLMAGTVVIALLLYFAIPDLCWPTFSAWIEANVSIAKWRFHGFPNACLIPHGAVLLLSQAILPVIIVLGVAIPVTSAHFDPSRFIEDLKNNLYGQLHAHPQKAKPLTIGMAIVCFWIAVGAAAFISFTPSDANLMRSRPFRPQENVFAFLVWFLMMFVPQLTLLHVSAGGSAHLRSHKPTVVSA